MNNAKKQSRTIKWERLEILFKKIGDIKPTFHARMGMMKERNSKDLTEAEKMKRWQEYTEELYKKGLNNQDNHDDVVTHQELDFSEFEVNGPQEALLQTKLVEVMGFQLCYFKS